MTPRFPLAALLPFLALAACDEPKPRPAAPGAKPVSAEAPPRGPDWADEFIGRVFTQAFPGELAPCDGATDVVELRYDGAPGGVKIVGWGWDLTAKAAVPRVILVDAAGLIVGAGETGLPRPDVNAAKPAITSPTTGWAAVTTRTRGPIDAYGLVASGKALCRLGHLEY